MYEFRVTPTDENHKYALEVQTLDYLNKLLARINPKVRASKKPDIIAAILAEFRGEGLGRLFHRLDRLQQATVAEAAHSTSGRVGLSQIVAKYGDLPDLGKFNRWGDISEPSLLLAFLFNWRLPTDLKERLSQITPVPPPATLPVHDKDPVTAQYQVKTGAANPGKGETETVTYAVTVEAREQAAQEDVRSVLRTVSAAKLNVSDRTFLPAAATVPIVCKALSGGDYYAGERAEDREFDALVGPIKPIAWTCMLQAAKFAAPIGKRLMLTPAGHEALKSRPADVLKILWERWLDNEHFDEMRRVDAIKGQATAAAMYTPATYRRKQIVAALRQSPIGKWFEVRPFWRYLVASGLDFAVSQDPWALYVGDTECRLSDPEVETWPILQGRYILCLLLEYAATAGLVDIATISPIDVPGDYGALWAAEDLDFLSRYDGLVAIRINALGAYCLGIATEYSPPARTQLTCLRILPNRDIVIVRPPLPAGDALLLEMFAARSSEVVWRLDQAKALGAMENGHAIADFRSMLTERNEGALPEMVTRFLDEMEERGGKLHARGAALLIECGDPHLLTLLTHDPCSRAHCMQAGPRHLVVLKSSEKAFLKAVHQMGYILPSAL